MLEASNPASHSVAVILCLLNGFNTLLYATVGLQYGHA